MIYLASPYSDVDPTVRERFDAACAAAAALMVVGHLVYSPIVHGHPLMQHGLPGDWTFWEPHARWHLERCDEVVVLMLNGWEESEGVKAELSHAGVLGKPVSYRAPAGELAAGRIWARNANGRENPRGLKCRACGSRGWFGSYERFT